MDFLHEQDHLEVATARVLNARVIYHACAGVDRKCSQVAVFARIDGGCWLWWRYVGV